MHNIHFEEKQAQAIDTDYIMTMHAHYDHKMLECYINSSFAA